MTITDPYFPPIDAVAEQEIGRFLVVWNVMEAEIDLCLSDLLRAGTRVGRKVAANLMLQNKLRLAKSLFSDLRDLSPVFKIGPAVEAEFDRLVKSTDTANEHRNAIVHGRPVLFDLDPPAHMWIKWSGGRDGLKGAALLIAPGMLAKPTEEAMGLAKEWNALRRSMEHCLTSFALSDADILLSGGEEEPETWELQTPAMRSSHKPTR